MKKIAIDFGTTNTVVSAWRESTRSYETIHLAGLSQPRLNADLPPIIPSLVYVMNGTSQEVLAGQEVPDQGLDIRGDNRFFSSFKRGIAVRSRPIPTEIDGQSWDDSRAGEAFLSRILNATIEQEGDFIDELIFTVPIPSFERYLKWLRDEALLIEKTGTHIKRFRVVDESTAAALGYEIRTPGELLMVFDFGGGTLDVSLVRMPVAEEGSGVVIEPSPSPSDAKLGSYANVATTRVVAKAGRVLGGDDVDHWLLDELLLRCNVARRDVGSSYSQLKQACEAAKVHLSKHESAEISVFDPVTERTYQTTFTRSQLEDLLDRSGFYSNIHKTTNQVLRTARAHGIFPEDIDSVLMIGGTSQIPSVSRIVRAQFGPDRVFDHKPFEAVSHGALALSAGLGLDDYLYHSYGVRHLSPLTIRHEWEEIIPTGARYPLEEPIRFVLAPSRDGQEVLELVIGEVEETSGGMAEVKFGDRTILMVEGSVELRRVIPLNDESGARTVARLDPPGKAGRDRVEVIFDVDHNRTLRVTVTDLLTNRVLLDDIPVVELR